MSITISGVYLIRCTSNQKVYVGSSVDIYKRWRTHKSMLNRNRHHSKFLQNAWNKYGKALFELEILETCLPILLVLRLEEKKWIEKLKAADRRYGYNYLEASQGIMDVNVFCGSNSKRSKLHEDDIIAIYERALNGERPRVIAQSYGVSDTTIRGILHGKTWKHVERNIIPKARNIGSDFWKSKLKESDIPVIEKLISEGETYRAIAEIFNVTPSIISRIYKGKLWKHSRTEKELQRPEAIQKKSTRGSLNGTAKLKESDILEIKELVKSGKTYKEIGKIFGVGATTIGRVAYGKNWKHVSNDCVAKFGNGKLSEEQVREIKRRLENGEKLKSIAKDYNVSRRTINSIKLGETKRYNLID